MWILTLIAALLPLLIQVIQWLHNHQAGTVPPKVAEKLGLVLNRLRALDSLCANKGIVQNFNDPDLQAAITTQSLAAFHAETQP